ncbi:acyl-CoA dehydrogenase family protein [Cupriavidus basilensis]|uniref:Acyl-CoA dehydrogenase family protein n=1 Tax=Cupriavidus basilensis TaxID=68895 RepID=A0ABT6AQF0_9BURK|nr:acyl-CoA dehydrogenase family protein [Cupriavidus basilensis]MDF3834844.1 acyl-CoA dehydrogenase family protein [Cupriavidus basilensis]
MDQQAIQFGEALEAALGDPVQAHSAINFHASLELDEQEAFPQAHLDSLRELGCFEQLIPLALGGALAELERTMLMSRLISRRDLTTAIAFGQTMLGSIPIWLAGSPAQQRQAADLLRQGGLACLALTEKEHGSDILSTEFLVRQQGGSLLASGSKWLINNGRRGASLTVLCRVERADGGSALGLLWLRRPQDADSAATTWRSHPKIRTLGIRGADISGFQLHDHPCGADALVCGPEAALFTVLKTLQISRVLCAGFSLGAVDTLFRLTFRFAYGRRLYGKLASDIPMVKAKLARSYAGILVADLVAQIACRAIAANPAELSLLSAVAKCHVPAQCEEIARQLALVLGARHYVRSEYPWGVFQKLMRDSQVVSLFDGSTQVNLSLVATQLRALGAGLRRKLEAGLGTGHLDQVRPLLWRDESSKGWPAQSQLRLTANGEDSLLAAFFEMQAVRREAAQPPALEQALTALETRLRLWLAACHAALELESLGQDTVRVMQLAEQYVGLHAAACAALAWHLHRGTLPAYRLDDAVLLEYLAGALPEAGIVVEDAQRQALVDAAAALIEQPRLISLSDVRISDGP